MASKTSNMKKSLMLTSWMSHLRPKETGESTLLQKICKTKRCVCARYGATLQRCTFPGGCKRKAIRYNVCYTHGAPRRARKECLFCHKNARKGGICQSHRAKRENKCRRTRWILHETLPKSYHKARMTILTSCINT